MINKDDLKERVGFLRNIKKGEKAIIGIVIFILLLIMVNGNLDRNDAGYYKIIQYLNGSLEVRVEPGYFIKWFGKVTAYPLADTLYYSKWPDESRKDQSVDVRFTDGSIGYVSMNVRYTLPMDKENILRIHKVFRSNHAFQLGAIEQMAMQAVQLTASMMTAEDSYRNKRPQFIQMVTDQIMNGLYVTITEKVKLNSEGETLVQKIVYNDDGSPKRQIRDLEKYNVTISQVNVTDIDYEKAVNDQISKKREASMGAELAKVEAEKARQARVQAEEEGKRNVTVAQYLEEEEKIKAITQATKDKEVATISALKEFEVAKLEKQKQEIEVQKAQLEKKAMIERAEAEAQARKLVMQADGALEKELQAYVEVHRAWAEAYTMQRPTPDITIGEKEGNQNMAQTLMDLLTINTAKDLALDMSVPKE